VSAGTTVTLDAGDAEGDFIFNISGYVTFGAGVNVVVENAKEGTRVIWNITGTYISTGADSNIIGLLLANGYVSTGANSTVKGVNGSGGGVYSATSYITAGAGAIIGDAKEK